MTVGKKGEEVFVQLDYKNSNLSSNKPIINVFLTSSVLPAYLLPLSSLVNWSHNIAIICFEGGGRGGIVHKEKEMG